MQFADVGGHGAGKHAVPACAAGAQLFADLGGGSWDGDRTHEVNGNTAEMQGAHATASARSTADDGARARCRGGGGERDAVEPAGGGSGAGDGQMAGVDRIEAAAEVADVHFCRGLMIKPR